MITSANSTAVVDPEPLMMSGYTYSTSWYPDNRIIGEPYEPISVQPNTIITAPYIERHQCEYCGRKQQERDPLCPGCGNVL